MQTALRETNEELGIPPERIAVLGALPEIKSIEGSPVIPIVGTTTMGLDELTPAQDEVAAIFAFEWTLFEHDKCQFFWLNLFGLRRRSSVFFAADLKIWGLTAHALYTARIG
jgi:8-oxo-dGTP pyrophosphatase MutT (NUDIX family)